MMYNAIMADNDVLDTLYLFQPRGPGTAWLFRMPTPAALIGRTNPRTGKPYGREIREGLGGILDIRQARRLRDLRLGKIRLEEAEALSEINGSMKQALEIAAELKAVDDPERRETFEHGLLVAAEQIEARAGHRQATRWYKTATGQRSPLKDVIEQYKADAGKTMSLSTLNNLNTAIKEFLAYAGEDVALGQLLHRDAAAGGNLRQGVALPNGDGTRTDIHVLFFLRRVLRLGCRGLCGCGLRRCTIPQRRFVAIDQRHDLFLRELHPLIFTRRTVVMEFVYVFLSQVPFLC